MPVRYGGLQGVGPQQQPVRYPNFAHTSTTSRRTTASSRKLLLPWPSSTEPVLAPATALRQSDGGEAGVVATKTGRQSLRPDGGEAGVVATKTGRQSTAAGWRRGRRRGDQDGQAEHGSPGGRRAWRPRRPPAAGRLAAPSPPRASRARSMSRVPDALLAAACRAARRPCRRGRGPVHRPRSSPTRARPLPTRARPPCTAPVLADAARPLPTRARPVRRPVPCRRGRGPLAGREPGGAAPPAMARASWQSGAAAVLGSAVARSPSWARPWRAAAPRLECKAPPASSRLCAGK
nr:uncharacterized protein LOC127310709 [Lolium perenne]